MCFPVLGKLVKTETEILNENTTKSKNIIIHKILGLFYAIELLKYLRSPVTNIKNYH